MIKSKDYFGNIMPFKKDYLGNLDSTYVPQYALSATTSPQTANQIAEATARLNAGILGVDISMVQPEVMEQIPKEHFKEINRLMKLTGARPTLHGPIVDLAGFTREGWSEESRKQNEIQVKHYVDRAHDLDENGNIPINFHISTMMPGENWRKISKEEYNKLSKEEREPDFIREIRPGEYEIKESEGVVNADTGQLTVIKREIKEYPTGIRVLTPEHRLDVMNQTSWDDAKLKVFDLQHQEAQVNDRLLMLNQQLQPYEKAFEKNILTDEEKKQFYELKKQEERLRSHISELDDHVRMNLSELYHQLKYAPKEGQAKANEVINAVKEDPNLKKFSEYQDRLKNNKKLSEEEIMDYHKSLQKGFENVQLLLNHAPTPKVFRSANEFAKEKTTETVANVAFDSYNKHKNNSPIIVLENFVPDLVLGRSADVVKTVEETRNKFVERLVKEKNISRDDAKKTAEKLIGVTWDVGHINFLRRHGYSEKDILEETKKIAPYVKQLHITDNFGFSDAHLPPGMGNVPVKEQLKILEKAGFKFEKGNVIVEAGGYVQQFKENPHLATLDYFESPLYTYKTMPYWKDIWETEGKYGLGYGATLPEQHYAMYGSGFSSLPIELGGQISGERSRFAGSPNQ